MSNGEAQTLLVMARALLAGCSPSPRSCTPTRRLRSARDLRDRDTLGRGATPRAPAVVRMARIDAAGAALAGGMHIAGLEQSAIPADLSDVADRATGES